MAQQAFAAFYNGTKVVDRSYVVFSKYDLICEAPGNHAALIFYNILYLLLYSKRTKINFSPL